MTLIFDKKSWHYRLILWSFGEHFFDDAKIDWKKVDSISGDDLKKIEWNGLPRTYTPKTVNFCPYCRSLVGSIITAPFVYLWRLYPHKPKPPLTREQIKKNSRRRTIISASIASGINVAFGLGHLYKYFVNGDTMELASAILQIGIGIFVIFIFTKFEKIGKFIIWMSEHLPKWTRKRKVNVKKQTNKKDPSKLAKKLHEKHEIICPPVFFIDKTNDEEFK